jgi:hypothetical protein
MAAIKITKFLGVAPKNAPELLPDTAAQIARNCKLYSGNLVPYPEPVAVSEAGTLPVGESIRTIYGLRNPTTAALEWLTWTTNVDIAVSTPNEDGDQRFYYTGDGVPKVANYALASQGLYYDLGLPIPPKEAQLITTAFPVETLTVATFERDISNTTRLTTTAPHNLRTGNTVTVSGFTQLGGTYLQVGVRIVVNLTTTEGGVTQQNEHGLEVGSSVVLVFTGGKAISGAYTVEEILDEYQFVVLASTSQGTSGGVQLSLKAFNGTNVEVSVIDDTTFEYFNPGPKVSTLTPVNAPTITLSGLTQARTYTYTWITPWLEESIAAKPSEELFIKEGQSVRVTFIPAHPPAGNNYARGVRLYRTLPSLSGTDFFLLKTLWFPMQLASVSRNQDVSRVTTRQWYPHNLSIDDVFLINNCSDQPSFNIVGGVVTDVIDEYTFEYYQEGAVIPETAVNNGTIYHDISEDPGTTGARYWGLGSYDFLDDFDSRLLLTTLGTDEYDAPPKNLQGLIQVGNNILAGFVGNELFFSEPGHPHAWPRSYSVLVEHNIVGIAAITGSILVTTESYPYIVSVTDPAAGASVSRIDVQYPCLNRRSIATMPYGIVYVTHGGLAIFSPFSGAQIITQENHYSETWNQSMDVTTLVGSFYNEVYLAAHSTGGLVYERGDKDSPLPGMMVDLDVTFSAIWYDALTNRLYFAKAEDNTIYEWNVPNQPSQYIEWKSKVIKTQDMINIGAGRVLGEFGGEIRYWGAIPEKWNEATFTWNTGGGVQFSMWVNRQLVANFPVTDTGTFRLPTGYRADTFEVAVAGTMAVRSIHLAETPLGLKAV